MKERPLEYQQTFWYNSKLHNLANALPTSQIIRIIHRLYNTWKILVLSEMSAFPESIPIFLNRYQPTKKNITSYTWQDLKTKMLIRTVGFSKISHNARLVNLAHCSARWWTNSWHEHILTHPNNLIKVIP